MVDFIMDLIGPLTKALALWHNMRLSLEEATAMISSWVQFFSEGM